MRYTNTFCNLIFWCLSFVSLSGIAQNFPTKPIRIIEPAGPGSAVDVFARQMAPGLSELLGQQVIIENRPGANSSIGAREVARSLPDGYNLLHGNVNNSLNDLLTQDECCLLNKALLPVTRLNSSPLVMVVNPSVPANNLKEYIVLAKSKPKFVNAASGGTGSITQLLGELIKKTADIQVQEVPYKAIGAELPDLLAGHVMTAFLAPAVVKQYILTGKLRALGVAGSSRLVFLPDVPTLAEGGLVGVEAYGWNGLFVPAGTPKAVINKLQLAVSQVLSSKVIQDDAILQGYRTGGESSDEFATFVRAEVSKWGKVIKDANIKLE
ncbi:MAG: tripartite tricarboxylate transporter substrate binding protein [Betaproteobacteria bacterium]